MKKDCIITVIFVLVLISLTGCTPEQQLQNQIDDLVSEEITYTNYANNGFSIDYPYWPVTENNDARVEISVSKGFCTVMINTEDAPADQLYALLVNSIEDSNGTLILTDETSSRIKYSALYNELTMISDSMIYGCNGKSHIVSVVCIEQANNDSQHIHKRIFESANCEKDETISEESTNLENSPAANEIEEEITYNEFEEGDFTIKHPDGETLEEVETRVFGVTKGICSVIVDKHNARPGDVIAWLEATTESDKNINILNSRNVNGAYYFDYSQPYKEYQVTSKSKLIYCNYMTYMTQVLCLDELTTASYEDMRTKVLASTKCSEEYEIPTPKIIEEKKEVIKEEEPEVIEELEDEIVKTDAGDEFGIDEEMVVYFINNNAFFGKIMKDFPKGNLVIEDTENDRELKLRATIDDDGKITLLEDGEFSDADVTLIIPLRDALNIFSNAQNINPLTLLGFAINVKTDPASIKDDVIQNVLKGEYN